MTQANTRCASYDEIIADPLFRAGYAEIWEGAERSCDARWSITEDLAYERGRQFGVYVRMQGEGQVPLMRGHLPHSRAKLLLMFAMKDGDVL